MTKTHAAPGGKETGRVFPLSAKLGAMLALSTLVVLLAMFAYTQMFRVQLLEERSALIAETLQAEVDTSIAYKLDILLTNALSLARNPQVREALRENDPDLVVPALKGIAEDFVAADLRGTQFHLIRADLTSFWRSFSAQRNDDISFRALLQQVARDGKPATGVELGRIGPRLRALAPVRDNNGQLLGVVEMLFGVGSISRQMRANEAFYILLVERDQLQSPTSGADEADRRIGGGYLSAHAKWFDADTLAFARAVDYAKLREQGQLLTKDALVAAVPAVDAMGKPYGLHLVGLTRAAFDRQAADVFRLAIHLQIGVAVLLVAMSVALVFLMRWLVVRPVTALSDFLLHLNNRLHQRFDWHSRDEIGQVASSVNALLAALEEALGRVRHESEELAAASGQLESIAQGIAGRAEQNHAQSASAATAGEELAATSADVATNCSAAADASNRAHSATVQGAELVKQAAADMQARGENTRAHAQMVGRLGEHSASIQGIVATIEAIADQTNLLALNAAIEAARAGDHGRGFAVVADEVRALAQRTTTATKEIANMIATINQETGAAIASLDEGVKDAERGAEDAVRIDAALKEILADVNVVTEQINQIATAAEQQTAVTAEIARTMTDINDAAGQNTTASAELTSSAGRLSELAGVLEREVRQFA